MHIEDKTKQNPEALALAAQQGNDQSREALLETYQPYIYKTASRCCKQFLQQGVDEELSVALLAFNEAIDSYRPKQGAGFLSFARLVIERRLADFFRKNASLQREIPFSSFAEEEEAGTAANKIERDTATQEYSELEARRDRQEEILYFRELLWQYRITLSELVRISPKHADARKRAMQAARIIAGDQQLLDYFKTRSELPLKALENKLAVSRKTLERQRKYIISLLLVYIEDLPHIREYLKGDEADEDQGNCPGSGKK
ncbi:MAG: RNA polymerase sigma-I factor [Bacillota bacterium]|nr:RNA polymerase sigma-I factor [Bacillota bacterium]MDW7682485.1 RNA polymerase sigma-I factor [Bacillota bacterium]